MNRVLKHFEQSFLELYQLDNAKDGNHLVDLNYPNNLCYKGLKFNEASILRIQTLLDKSLGYESKCIFVGYLLDIDKFIALNDNLIRNGIIFRIENGKGITERKVTCDSTTIKSRFKSLIQIFKEK